MDRVRLKSIFQEVQKNKVLKLKDIEKILKVNCNFSYQTIIYKAEWRWSGILDYKSTPRRTYSRKNWSVRRHFIYWVTKNKNFNSNVSSGIIDDSFKNSEWKDLERNLENFRKSYEGYIEKLRNEKSN